MTDKIPGIPMPLQRVDYESLNARQKEIYNFQKIAGALADYGFICIKLSDDWNGADFLARYGPTGHTLLVQLKSRLVVSRKYLGKGLHMAFPIHGHWYLVEHDSLIECLGQHSTYLTSDSWQVKGNYSTTNPSASICAWLAAYRLGAEGGLSQG